MNIGDNKRIFVVSDIHNHGSQFQKLLEQIQLHHPENLLVIAGDAFDKGGSCSDPWTIYQTWQSYPKKIILLKGNHEEMLGSFLIRRYGQGIKEEYPFETEEILRTRMIEKELLGLGYLLKSLPVYFEVKLEGKLFQIAHAFVPRKTEFSRTNESDFFYRQMDYGRKVYGKNVIITGHVRVEDMPSKWKADPDRIWQNPSGTIYNINTGLAYDKGILSYLCLPTMETGYVR